ncbi:unnamed protein product [Calypogeia fissa]
MARKPSGMKRLPAAKAAPIADNAAGLKKKHKAKKIQQSYKMYLYKVLKQVHPDVGVSATAMSILNSFIVDIFEKIATEAGRLARYNKKPTISSREIQTAVKLLLPGELAKHAVEQASSAVVKFMDA